MQEATWVDGTTSPEIDWRMSAAPENVPRGESDLAEMTSLAGATAAWRAFDPAHRTGAILTPNVRWWLTVRACRTHEQGDRGTGRAPA